VLFWLYASLLYIFFQNLNILCIFSLTSFSVRFTFLGSTGSLIGSIPITLIHSDFCGPMFVPSTFANRYMMTFINDYTRTYWVYLLKQKSQAFETFKNFHLWIENEVQYHIGTLSIDNGREYTSNEFE
jgi:hypothetical protein